MSFLTAMQGSFFPRLFFDFIRRSFRAIVSFTVSLEVYACCPAQFGHAVVAFDHTTIDDAGTVIDGDDVHKDTTVCLVNHTKSVLPV